MTDRWDAWSRPAPDVGAFAALRSWERPRVTINGAVRRTQLELEEFVRALGAGDVPLAGWVRWTDARLADAWRHAAAPTLLALLNCRPLAAHDAIVAIYHLALALGVPAETRWQAGLRRPAGVPRPASASRTWLAGLVPELMAHATAWSRRADRRGRRRGARCAVSADHVVRLARATYREILWGSWTGSLTAPRVASPRHFDALLTAASVVASYDAMADVVRLVAPTPPRVAALLATLAPAAAVTR